MSSNFFHAHCHSNFSPLDAMADVPKLVAKAVKHGQPALALTDHGLGSGWVKLYKECKAAGIKPYPGIETYLIDPEFDDWENPEKGEKVGRYHVILLALNERGYKALVKFTSLTHTRPRFNRFARCTLSDLYDLGKTAGDDIALLTGCFFGLVQQYLVTRGEQDAMNVISMFKQMFKNVFIEVQHHNIVHDDGTDDDDLVESLFAIADKMRLPVVATQDCHYLDRPDKTAHELMKKMTYGNPESEFPGDAFHLASTDWVQEHYTKKQWRLIESGYAKLLDLGNVTISPLDKFEPDLPLVKGVADPVAHLRKHARRGLLKYLKFIGVSRHSPDGQVYMQRYREEMETIEFLKMPAYFVIWERFVQWCNEMEIAIEARGSANGSLVCFVLGITQIDPIIFKTMFARFLSKDRIKPPDIDMDIEDAERPRAVQYMLSLYESVQIGTFGKLGVTRNDDGEETGSVFRTWQAWKRHECEQIATRRWEQGKLAKKGDIVPYSRGIYAKRYAQIREIEDVRTVSEIEYEGLRRIEEMGSVYKSYGVHAGGILLAGQRIKIEDYIPTMLVASSDTRVSQFDMDDVEKFGLLKMDILGQATLNSMKRAMKLIDPDWNPTDFTWIENDDEDALKWLRSGRMNTGIFHQEGWTKSKGWRELGVKSVEDAIIGQALYMPGCMDVAPGQSMSMKDLYLKRRKNPKLRKQVTYIHPVFEKVLSPTYGCVIFQEQVIDIMRGLGMDIAGINEFFAVVKDSGRGSNERNEKRMKKVRAQFDQLCKKAGIDPDEAWSQTASFVSYGFNRAHASGYGVRSYRTGYMKAHHELEHMTGLLQTWAGRDKESAYIAEARRTGIRILPAHVNISSETWTMDPDNNAIRKGLASVAGIGPPTAAAIHQGAPYSSINDMIERLPARVISGGTQFKKDGTYSGNLAKLRDAGALDGITPHDIRKVKRNGTRTHPQG